MGEFQVCMYWIDEGNAALKYLVGNRSIKVKEIITPQAMILRLFTVADDSG